MRFSDAATAPSGRGGVSGLRGDGGMSSDSDRCCITAWKKNPETLHRSTYFYYIFSYKMLYFN